MIFLTGDTHGDFTRFSSGSFPEQRDMNKDDLMLICGDFGGLWDGSRREAYWLDWLEDKPFTTLFVSGNHENYDLLSRCPVEMWKGGRVQAVRPSVLHLMRGQVFQLGGRRVFTMGGASSHDMADGILDPAAPDFRAQRRRLNARRALYRIDGRTWWKEELPSGEEYQEAEKNLNACGRQVDWIASHCCPSSVEEAIGSGYRHDALTGYFETLKETCQFRHWFFGHYHDNRILQGKYVLLYEQIILGAP